MDLSELNELDLNNIANWPLPARIAVIAMIFAGVLGLGYWLDIKDQRISLEKAESKETELRQTFESKAKKAANLAAADAAIAGNGLRPGSPGSAQTQIVNFVDTGEDGNFVGDLDFPGTSPGDDDNFVMRLLDHLGLEADRGRRWGTPPPPD